MSAGLQPLDYPWIEQPTDSWDTSDPRKSWSEDCSLEIALSVSHVLEPHGK